MDDDDFLSEIGLGNDDRDAKTPDVSPQPSSTSSHSTAKNTAPAPHKGHSAPAPKKPKPAPAPALAFPDMVEYEVEAVLDRKEIRTASGNKVCYLVKWKDWDAKYNSWEPADCLNCPNLLQQFQESRPASPSYSRETSPLPEGQWEVETVLERRTLMGRGKGAKKFVQYRVKWKNWDEQFNQWVNEEDLFCFDLLEDFHRKHPSPSTSASAKKTPVRPKKPGAPKASPTSSDASVQRKATSYSLRSLSVRPDYTGRLGSIQRSAPVKKPASAVGSLARRAVSQFVRPDGRAAVDARRKVQRGSDESVSSGEAQRRVATAAGIREAERAAGIREAERARRDQEAQRRKIVTREARQQTPAERKDAEKRRKALEKEKPVAKPTTIQKTDRAAAEPDRFRILFITDNRIALVKNLPISREERAEWDSAPYTEEGVTVLGMLTPHEFPERFVLIKQRVAAELFLAVPVRTVKYRFPATYRIFRDAIKERARPDDHGPERRRHAHSSTDARAPRARRERSGESTERDHHQEATSHKRRRAHH